MLEIFNPTTDALIVRWDIDIVYSWSSGDGSFWTDTEQLKYHIRKAGLAPERGPLPAPARTPSPAGPMSRAGATARTARPTAWCGRASARPSSTTASAATPPTGGRA